jgi:hypothetical protein
MSKCDNSGALGRYPNESSWKIDSVRGSNHNATTV